MSERRFWFVINKGKLDYVQDNVAKEKITVTELEDLLNALNDENRELRQSLDSMIETSAEISNRNVLLHQEIGKLKGDVNRLEYIIEELRRKYENKR